MKITELAKEEIEEIRKYAKRVAEEPFLVDLIATLCCDIIDRKKKDITRREIEYLQEIREEEDQIPLEILRFLKENVTRSSKAGKKAVRLARLLCFVEEIREKVLQNVKADIKISCYDIRAYAEIFDIYYIMEHIDKSELFSNEIRLIIAVAINEDDYEGILQETPEIIDSLENLFYGFSEKQMKNLMKVHKFFAKNNHLMI